MQKVIVRVPGAGSLVVETELSPSLVLGVVNICLGQNPDCKLFLAKRGAPKKVMPEASVISEGAAG